MKRETFDKSGNALFLILIAVALFAALGYAVTKSRTDSSTIEREKTTLAAGRLLAYASYVRAGAQRMALTGTSPDDILLTDTSPAGNDPCTSGADCLFAKEGGGVEFIPPPTGLGNGVLPVLYEKARGVYIPGVGTSAAELVLAYGPLSLDACSKINKGLGLGSGVNSDTDPVSLDIDAYPGESQACTEAAGDYYYYMVLIEN